MLLCFFFLFLVMLNNFLLFLFPAGAPVTLAKQIIDTTPLVADKTIKVLSI